MKKYIFAVITSILTFFAIWLLGGRILGFFIWMFIFGDTHGHVYEAIPNITMLLGIVVAGIFLFLVLLDKLSRKYIRIHFWISTFCICYLLFSFVSFRVGEFKGWTAESAVRASFKKIHPKEKIENFTFIEEGRKKTNAWTNVYYLVKEGAVPKYRIGVSNRHVKFWSYSFNAPAGTKIPGIDE